MRYGLQSQSSDIDTASLFLLFDFYLIKRKSSGIFLIMLLCFDLMLIPSLHEAIFTI